MKSPEAFGPKTGVGLEQEFSDENGRRGILLRALERASQDPLTGKDGLDLGALQKEVGEEARGTIWAGKEMKAADLFQVRFRKGVKYAPLAVFEGGESSEAPAEIQELRIFYPKAKKVIDQLVESVGGVGSAPESGKVILGFGAKTKDGSVITGGYHSSLTEQGYKSYDGILQENVMTLSDVSQEYRTLDLLRSVAHDSIHAAQFKLFGRKSLGRDIAVFQEQLMALDGKTDKRAEKDRKKLLKKIAKIEQEVKETDLEMRQYGSLMLGIDKNLEDEEGKLSLGAALFEYTTDTLARRLVHAYIEKSGLEKPTPRTPLEQLMQRDLQGERIKPEDIEGLEGDEKKMGEMMVKYGFEIVKPAERVLSAFGSLRPKIEQALIEAMFTGKFRKMKALGKELLEKDFTLDDGSRINAKEIAQYAEAAKVLHALFGRRLSEFLPEKKEPEETESSS